MRRSRAIRLTDDERSTDDGQEADLRRLAEQRRAADHRRQAARAVLVCVGMLIFLMFLIVGMARADGAPSGLEQELGRNEVRIQSIPFELRAGGTVWGYALGERLERLGYRRVRRKPERVGEYFWGTERFWIYRRGFRWNRRDEPPRLIGLHLSGDRGRIDGVLSVDGEVVPPSALRLEPEILSESLDGRRARRVVVGFDAFPERLWRAVLAAEDARFFEHSGVDARSMARALLANIKAGGVAQGGSTITQQLIKNRDLSPRRSLGRKASEAMRALALEAEYDKEEILGAYLDAVYLGHVDGLAIHGMGTAARVYFSKTVDELSLAECAALAAMIQGPNRLTPDRHAERLTQRRNWVLSRLEELEWAESSAVAKAKDSPLRTRRTAPHHPLGRHFVGWVKALAEDEAPRHLAKGRGVVADTTLDPWLQAEAESAVATHLKSLRRRRGGDDISAALVALDAATGDVLAHVGGDPGGGDGFDRARRARRQPGSAVKPLLLLEAFDGCGAEAPLYPSIRVADEPLRMELPSGPWEPRNSDGEFHGVVSLREALRESYNVPFVRIARHCGFRAMGRQLRRVGLDVPSAPPPSMALGALETTPVDLARAYTVLALGGERAEVRPVVRLERPGGRRIRGFPDRRRRAAKPSVVYMVNDLLKEAARDGTAQGAAVDGWEVSAKTGTTSDRRDAWLAGHGNGIVTVVWVGRDDGEPLGLGGGTAAAPLWRNFMEKALGSRPKRTQTKPDDVLELHVDARTGLLVRSFNSNARLDLFRRGAKPRRDRFWRVDESVPVIR